MLRASNLNLGTHFGAKLHLIGTEESYFDAGVTRVQWDALLRLMWILPDFVYGKNLEFNKIFKLYNLPSILNTIRYGPQKVLCRKGHEIFWIVFELNSGLLVESSSEYKISK